MDGLQLGRETAKLEANTCRTTSRTMSRFARIVPFFCHKDDLPCSADITSDRNGQVKTRETMHKPILVILWLLLACAHSHVRAAIWEPSPGHAQVPIWPGAVPDAMPNPKPESVGPPAGRRLYVKAESEAVDEAVTAVAEVGGQLKKDLERIAKDYPGVRIDLDPLPELEKRCDHHDAGHHNRCKVQCNDANLTRR